MAETPEERTKRMLGEERRKVIEHDEASRANQGKSQFSLRQKMRVTLPLVAIVFTLYSCSYLYTRRLTRLKKLKEMEANNSTLLKDAQDILNPLEATKHIEEHDIEFITDNDKKW